MDNNGENESLIVKEYYSQNEQCLGGSSSSSRESSNNIGDWWNESGTETVSSGSSYSDYGGSLYEWEAEIDARGELFYVESVRTTDSKDTNVHPTSDTEHTKELTATHSNRRSTKGKLAKLLQQQSSKHFKGKHGKTSQPPNTEEASTPQEYSSNKVTFQDWQQGEVREVTLPVSGRVAHNLGRRATLSEMLLGLTTSKFTDGIRIMVAGFIPNGEAVKHCGIKIGDWLQSINGQEVNGQTFDYVLSALKPPCEVILRLQRVAGCEVTIDEHQENATKVHWQSKLVRRLKGVDPPPVMVGQPVLALFLSGVDETLSQPEESEQNHGLLYCFPAQSPVSPLDVIIAARGAFITLCHLFPNAGASPPVSSSAVVNGELIHILYSSQDDGLLLIAVPDKRCPLWEAKRLLSDVVDDLEFCYKTLQRAFSDESNHQSLNQFFTLIFMRLLTDGTWPSKRTSLALHDEGPHSVTAKFEELLPVAPWLAMPQHIQIQIDTVLSRLEANDFGDMNDDPDCQQRLYTIVGSCYYHKGCLLSWHAENAVFVRIHLFLRQHGLLELNHREPVQLLLLWKEVFPIITAPTGARHFLLCAGKGHELLAILFESGGCAMIAGRNPGPDVCYVEAAQMTLDYIEKSGISSIASKWLSANRRPQVNPQDADICSRTYRNTENLLGFVKQLDPLTQAKTSATASSSVSPKKHPEVISILKRRSSPDRNFGYMSSGLSIQGSTSEDSASQAASVMSEMSDESAPILGRRAERERITRHGSIDRFSESLSEQSEESESDWEGQVNEGGPYDLTAISKAIALEVDDLRPSKLTAGHENVLFHYVDLNIFEGVLLSSLPWGCSEDQQKAWEIITNFKLSCQTIHELLQNTVTFKKLMSQELNKGLINKSLIAIKECGLLFEVNSRQSQTGKKSSSTVSYWVVGRLFSTPHPREVYVCYEDCASQNMVEIAFRLALNTTG